MLKEIARKSAKVERILLTFKVSKSELKAIKSKAARYSDGNISAWLRYVSMKYTPEISELTKAK